MRVLVTGGAGFIGSHVVAALVEAEHQVVVIDNLSAGKRSNVPSGARFVLADVLDAAAVERWVNAADCVVHLAAQVSVPASFEDPAASATVNVLGSINVLQAAARAGARVVLASSAAAQGVPVSPYGLDKAVMEQYASLLHPASTSLRFFNVYGPRMTAGVINDFIQQIYTHGVITIHGDGNQTRDFVHVSDVANAVSIAVEQTDLPPTLNIGTGESISINQLAALISTALAVDCAVEHAPGRAGDVQHSAADITLTLRSLPAWAPRISIKHGLDGLFS